MFKEIGVCKSAVNGRTHCMVKAAVQKLLLMSIRVDQELTAEFLQLFQQEAVRIKLRLPAAVICPAVDLKGNVL